MDATSTLQNLEAGITTPDKIVRESIARIDAMRPRLNATVEILHENAGEQLRHLPDGPLKGIPVSVKECYAMKGRKITSGSKRMKPILCGDDAAVVKRLKGAGAVIVSRGNTSEFLLGRETNNLLFGTTNNAINPVLTSGGSSGGEGSLVGSGCVAFGIGTDIGGSCRYPAVFNGIVGFKPASGQIDKSGIFPSLGDHYTETMNSPGILSRSVRDARLVYNVIADKKLSSRGQPGNFKLHTSETFRVKIHDASIADALSASVAALKAMASSVTDVAIPESGSLYPAFVTFITGGFTDKVYEWSVTEDGQPLSYWSEWLNRLKKRPTLSNEIFAMLPAFNMLKPSPAKLDRTIRKTEELRAKYHSLFGDNGILILPTTGILAPLHRKFIPQYNKPGVIEIITPVSFCNILNLSCITVPARRFQKSNTTNPPGIQLATSAGNEGLLLNVAEYLENELNSKET